MSEIDRRSFLKTAGAAAVAAAPSVPSKMVGIQVGAASFVDEGTGPVLDTLRQRGQVNTIFLAVFTFGRGIAGRQVPGQPLPDHGKQEYDLDFHGGNYATVHPQYYRDTPIDAKATRAPDHGDLDLLATVLPQAKQRGLRTICWLEDVWRPDIPGVSSVQEVDLDGRPARTLCFNNPGHRNFLLGLVEDYARSYEVDGIMWGCERHGALGNMLGASHGGGGGDASRVTCFCQHCARRAQAGGIRVERAREGFRTLQALVRETRAGGQPVDGAFVTFLRIAMRYPEIFAWEQLFHDSLRDTYAAIRNRVRAVNPNLKVGWHIWHNNSFSPFYRAQQDLKELAKVSDFLKMVMYHNCGGERMASYINGVGNTIFAGVPKEQLLEFEYSVMNYREPPLSEIPTRGLSADYVARETRRAMQAAAGTPLLIWPGIDLDIPTNAGNSKSSPEGTRAAVLAALKAGAHGVLLSRKYSEMRLANLSAAGEAVR
ncbi:MAG: twin-arginine translocation signal domain-containing protein, partial [Acidobacteria bacterium]|nr:twin-arginine translocation signal domain-containing protein [Acidobacteriota bacterium]